MDRPRLLVVANAAAGSATDEAVDAAVGALEPDATVAVVRTRDLEELDAALAERDPGTRLVVVGGDGSLHAVANALHRARALTPDEPLGLVPLGTGNDLARCLGIPLDAAEAARVVLTGRPRPLDVLVDDDDRVVVNMVHAGIGAEAARSAETWKEHLGSLGYAVGSLVAGTRPRGWQVEVLADGEPVAVGDEVLQVAVGIGTSVGGGALLAPQACADDGLADVVVASASGWLGRLGYALDLRDGEHVERADVVETTAREVTVRGEPFSTNSDGEVDGPFPSRTWRLRSHAWSLLVPAT